MKIEYLGHACFRITGKSGVSFITDPYTNIGYELSAKYEGDVALISHGHYDHAYIDGIEVDEVVKTVGEQQIKGIKVTGVESFHDEKGGLLRGKNVIYTLYIDGIKVTHLGDLGEPCREEIIERIGKADVLMLPVGGNYTIDALEAKKYVERINPKIAIPMHYKPKDGGIDIDGAEKFLSLFKKEEVLFVGSETEITDENIKDESAKILYMERKR